MKKMVVMGGNGVLEGSRSVVLDSLHFVDSGNSKAFRGTIVISLNG